MVYPLRKLPVYHEKLLYPQPDNDKDLDSNTVLGHTSNRRGFQRKNHGTVSLYYNLLHKNMSCSGA